MTRIRVQRNPSTGKVMRNTATGKVMTVDLDVAGDPCGCSPTPKYVNITLSGLVACCYTILGHSWQTTGPLSGTWHLEYAGKAGDICSWSNDHDLRAKWWTASDACDVTTQNEWDRQYRLKLLLDTVADTVELQWYNIEEQEMVHWRVLFLGSADVVSECVNATINNTLECEEVWGVYMGMATDGSAIVAQV